MDPVEREIFRQLFASIAEEMGATLMRSAFSPNIKERRDFSCAVFDADGEMVAQAAHIPVHLGSTPLSVQAAIEDVEMGRESHAVLNDPYRGGTHLPDITFVSPVCDADGDVRFYVANRAHHADVGGSSPGSLPLSDSIDDEGIRIPPTRWSDELADRIASASRTPDERRGDLQAQLAANLRGRERLEAQLQRHGDEAWRAAEHLQDYSERFMARTLESMATGTWGFEDVLDGDGFGAGPLELTCEVTLEEHRAVVDWTGTASQTRGPVNAPRAVTVSAVLYVFRCLAPAEMPSNGGYMRRIEVETESGTLVDAEYPAPVAIGNVETSQRITDVVLGALADPLPERIPAASCGSMNNVTIGGVDRREERSGEFTYYETIAGGSGAHAEGNGTDGIHTHMTNTLNTPVEALEHAYPFRVERYAVREESGGAGEHDGGNGVVRTYAFDQPATATLMTERRDHPPYGLCGGDNGARGCNVLVRDGEPAELPGKCTVELEAGDRLRIETPGGGGWGESTSSREPPENGDRRTDEP
jgi:N-methylhydantoinase B